MKDDYCLVQRFEELRPRLRQVAYRVLGSATEADDAVQEAWIRFSRSDIDQIDSLGGWLTTVVARVSFDMLRARASRREEPFDAGVERFEEPATPEAETILRVECTPDRVEPIERRTEWGGWSQRQRLP